MSPLAISGIFFACIVAGTLLGMLLRALLPDEHLSNDTKDVVKLGMGLIGTMTALVLGLLVASTKSGYDTQRNGVAQLAGNIIFLDRILARYGPESKEVREQLRASVADVIQRTWPGENPSSAPANPSGPTEVLGGTGGRYEGLYDKMQLLTPKDNVQRELKAQALKLATDIGQTRWLLLAQQGSSVPTPFLVVVGFWLMVLFASFSMFAPRNAMVFFVLLISALAVSSALFLILELDQPFSGFLQISSAPLRGVLVQLGR
jgi:hypothetical protein